MSVSVGVAVPVLLGVLLVGVLAGRAKQRWLMLLLGIGAAIVVGVVTTRVNGTLGADPAAKITLLYTNAVPLLVAFVAGWLCGRGSWFKRLVVLGVAALILAAFPYTAAGQATVDRLGDPLPGALKERP
jgi:hypothetical protein